MKKPTGRMAFAYSTIAMHEETIRQLQSRIDALSKDAERMDWLADRNNKHGNVSLPSSCVQENIHSMRDAIDAVMEIYPISAKGGE